MGPDSLDARLARLDLRAWQQEQSRSCFACGTPPRGRHTPECRVRRANVIRHARRPDMFTAQGDAILPQGEVA